MSSGGCLCGAVRYELAPGSQGRITHCHCSMCRKQHGAAFATYAPVARASFQLNDPQRALREYRSTPKVTRSFCAVCGSSLFWSHDGAPNEIDVAIGTLDGEPEHSPEAHIFTASKAKWVEISDALAQYEQSIPRAK